MAKKKSTDAETRRLARQNMAARQRRAEEKAEIERQIASWASRPISAMNIGVSPTDVAQSQRAANLRAIKAASSAAEQKLIREMSGYGTTPGRRKKETQTIPLLQEEKRIATRYRNQRGK